MSEDQQEERFVEVPFAEISVPDLRAQIESNSVDLQTVAEFLTEEFPDPPWGYKLSAAVSELCGKLTALLSRYELRCDFLADESARLKADLDRLAIVARSDEAADLAVSLANARDEIDALRIDRDALRAALTAEQQTKAPALDAAERDAAAPILPGDPREVDALRSELAELREARNTAQVTIEELRKQRETLDAELRNLRAKMNEPEPAPVWATRAAAPVSPAPAPVEGGEP